MNRGSKLWRNVVPVAMVMTVGCSKLLLEKPLEPGTYGSSEPELKRLWSDLLTAATRDERQRVIEMMTSMRMSQEELATLIGEDKARRFWPRYDLLTKPLSGPMPAELVASIYEHHYDDVEVTRVDTLPTESMSDAERVMKRALLTPTPFYRVRVVRKGHPYAIRYDFFVYQHGFWRTGRELGKYLEPPPPIVPAQAAQPSPQPAQPSSQAAQPVSPQPVSPQPVQQPEPRVIPPT